MPNQPKAQAASPTAVRETFLRALELPGEGRAQFLKTACVGNTTVRLRVEELLAEYETVGTFLDSPASLPSRAIPASEHPGDIIGRYRLIEKIGEGGAGVVYMAEQLQPVRRELALKVIKLGMDTKSVIARFDAERQALAVMDHPNIAKVFDGGATDSGRPFFVMELVRGVQITDYCNEGQLSPRERLVLFAQVCHAIQHAHQKGIIHRDIKPSNVLVTANDQGRGPAPKVIDFGIAKATEQPLTDLTLFTELSSFIGTPAYMSPEQIEMGSGHMDTRSDIYSLGVLLYELLTGQTPFPASLLRQGITEFRRAVSNEEPKLPSSRVSAISAGAAGGSEAAQREQRSLYKLLHGELDWIVMKCLEKDRSRRYATANDLAADIQRYLAGEPILARPPSATYRFQKFLNRHRVSVAAAAAMALCLLAASVFSFGEARRARRAEDAATLSKIDAESESKRAHASEARALLNEYVADLTLAQQALAAGNFGRATFLLAKHAPQPGQPDLRSFEWGHLFFLSHGNPHQTVQASGESVRAVAFSPDQKWIALGARNSTRVLDAATFREVASARRAAYSLAFAPNNQRLYVAGPGSLSSLDLPSGRTQTLASDAGAPLALAPDGQLLAAAGRDKIRIFHTDPWAGQAALFRSSGPFVFSPDASHLFASTRGGLLDWTIEGDADPREISSPLTFGFFHQQANVLAFSPDGKKIFAPRDRMLAILDSRTGAQIGVIPKDGKPLHTSTISTIAIPPDGKTIATASWDHSIQLWDTARSEHLLSLQGHLNEVWSLAFSPDGQTLLSGAKDGGVYLWPLAQTPPRDFIAGDWQPVRSSPDENSLLAINRQGHVAEINLASGAVNELWSDAEPERRPFNAPISASADLQVIARIMPNRMVQIFDRPANRHFNLPRASEPISSATLSPNGKLLVLASASAVCWNLETMTNYTVPAAANRVLFTPDSQRLILLPRGATGSVWNLATHTLERELTFENASGFESAISPDNRTLAVAALPDISNTIEILDIQTGQSLGVLAGHKQGIRAVAFSDDGKTIASASSDGVKLWNAATLQETLTFPAQSPGQPVFSPAGSYLAFHCRIDNQEGIQLLKAVPITPISHP